MRRDIGFYVEANIEQVYKAYLNAAVNKPFERSCNEEPFHTITFGLNFSMKYNMNGGSCHIHFMPCGSGTAVNIRFVIAQAVGARCERYVEDLNTAMQAFLPVVPQPASYNMDDFLKPENQITPASVAQPAAPVVAPAAAPVAAPISPAASFCASCGNALAAGSRFCSRCGKPVAVPKAKVCPACQAPAQENALFCAKCGTRL